MKAILKTLSLNRRFQFENNLKIQDQSERARQIAEFERQENIRRAEQARNKLDQFLSLVNARREKRKEDRKLRVMQ